MSGSRQSTSENHATSEPAVVRGTCFALFAYDVALQVDLDEAQRRVTAGSQRQSIRHKRRTPDYFEYQPAPLRVTQTVSPLALGGHTTSAAVDYVIYDFGAVSVTYTIPLSGPVSRLLELSDELYDNEELLEHSRRGVETLLNAIGSAAAKPAISELVEDYSIYQIETLTPAARLDHVVVEHGPTLARILRAEAEQLSRQEIDDALACQLSYGDDDRTIIDWNAALLFGADADDVRAVLEFANVELLEMRYLDDRLDEALDQSYAAMFKRSGRRRLMPGSQAGDLWRIAELQMDSAMLFEGVNNALKLLGDQYLARVYRLTSQRFHLQEWDGSILRKLQTIESIYEKISDKHANWRVEVLEWIIIILIAVSILMEFIPGLHGS